MPFRCICPLLSVVAALVLLHLGPATAQEGTGPPSARAATAEVNGIEIRYRIVGTGPSLLLLHGFSGAGAW